MFDTLSTRLDDIFTRLRSRGRLSEKQVEEVLREIRLALLEADVSLKVVKAFVKDVRERADGAEIHKSLTPAQQVIKIVNQALIDILGEANVGLEVSSRPPRVILMAGLQGSGKTTSSGKLARLLKSQGRKPILAAADLRRPAAIRQLQLLGEQVGVPVHAEPDTPDHDAAGVAGRALEHARDEGYSDLIVDTAGRMHVDPELMKELGAVAHAVEPTEILLVCDAMTGQDAVNVAESFLEEVEISGIILTKLDGDARGGAALSMAYVTGRPIKFAGVGEKLGDLEPFHPDRMASRILGMGDVLTLIEKAEKAMDEEKAREAAERMAKDRFTLEDFLSQLREVRKLGPLQDLLGMLPGGAQMAANVQVDEGQVGRAEAIISSMTPEERRNPAIIGGSRLTRIARGSGTSVGDVNVLLKQFDEARKMMKRLTGGRLPKLPGMPRIPGT